MHIYDISGCMQRLSGSSCTVHAAAAGVPIGFLQK
jgi:hypothetical protein